MNNPVFSEEFELHAINKTKATHWLKKVQKNPKPNWIALFILLTKGVRPRGKIYFNCITQEKWIRTAQGNLNSGVPILEYFQP